MGATVQGRSQTLWNSSGWVRCALPRKDCARSTWPSMISAVISPPTSVWRMAEGTGPGAAVLQSIVRVEEGDQC